MGGAIRRRPKARWWERRYAREGSERPRYRTIGQWRSRGPPTTPGATSRPSECLGPSLRSTGGEGRDKDREVSHRLARRLKDFNVDLSGAVVSYSGNASIHVRISDGAVGCTIIEMPGRQRKACVVFSTTSAGKTRRSGGRSTTPAYTQASSSAPSVASTRPQGGIPSDARQMSFCLSPPRFCFFSRSRSSSTACQRLFPCPVSRIRSGALCARQPAGYPQDSNDQKTNVSQSTSPQKEDGGVGAVIDRVNRGMREGEPWGPDVGRPCAVGRNWADLFVAHDVLRRSGSEESAWGGALTSGIAG
jgi:hypothetical protein